MRFYINSFIAGAAVAMLLPGTASAQEDCGTVTIAEMNWQSAEVLANIDRIILNEGYGCDAELVPGDTVPTFTSMNEKGEPDMAPELWLNSIREPLQKALDEGRLIKASPALADGGVEGWWIPEYVADANPDMKTIGNALEHPELFPAPEDSSKGAVHNCPSGWACEILTGNLFRAFDGEGHGFVLVDTGSAAGLDGSIARAYEREEGWLGYYWAPTSILGKYSMVKLDEGVEHDADEWANCTSQPDCPDPKPNAWLISDTATVVTKNFAETASVAMDYIKTREWGNDTVNELLAWMTDNQATGEEGAEYFLENYPEIWTQWVSPEAAEKVKASLDS